MAHMCHREDFCYPVSYTSTQIILILDAVDVSDRQSPADENIASPGFITTASTTLKN
jgi:hypothetical protein